MQYSEMYEKKGKKLGIYLDLQKLKTSRSENTGVCTQECFFLLISSDSHQLLLV